MHGAIPLVSKPVTSDCSLVEGGVLVSGGVHRAAGHVTGIVGIVLCDNGVLVLCWEKNMKIFSQDFS